MRVPAGDCASSRVAITRSSAAAASIVTPGFSRAVTWLRPIRSCPDGARSGVSGIHTSVRDSVSAPARPDAAPYGNWNESGMTPRTVNGRPSSAIDVPGSEGSPLKRRRQRLALITATCWGSSARNVRPASGATSRIEKNAPSAQTAVSRSTPEGPSRCFVVSAYPAKASTVVLCFPNASSSIDPTGAVIGSGGPGRSSLQLRP